MGQTPIRYDDTLRTHPQVLHSTFLIDKSAMYLIGAGSIAIRSALSSDISRGAAAVMSVDSLIVALSSLRSSSCSLQVSPLVILSSSIYLSNAESSRAKVLSARSMVLRSRCICDSISLLKCVVGSDRLFDMLDKNENYRGNKHQYDYRTDKISSK